MIVVHFTLGPAENYMRIYFIFLLLVKFKCFSRFIMASKDEIRILLAEQTDNISKILTNSKAEIIAEMNDIVKDIRNDLSKVETTTISLRNQVNVLHDEVERLKRQNDIIIRHIPFCDGECLNTVFKDIATTIGFNIKCMPRVYRLATHKKQLPKEPQNSQNIRVTRRNASASESGSSSSARTFSPLIVVKFYSMLDKLDFMAFYFRQMNLNLSHIGFNTNSRIIVSDNLTTKNNKVFIAAVALKKTGKLTKIQIKNGLVYVAISATSKYVCAYTVDELPTVANSS